MMSNKSKALEVIANLDVNDQFHVEEYIDVLEKENEKIFSTIQTHQRENERLTTALERIKSDIAYNNMVGGEWVANPSNLTICIHEQVTKALEKDDEG